MMIESFLIFISTIVSLNISNDINVKQSDDNNVKISQTTTQTPPVVSERKRGGWDGN